MTPNSRINQLDDIRRKLSEVLKDIVEYQASTSYRVVDAKVTDEKVRQAIAETMSLTWEQITEKARLRNRVTARQLYSYVMRTYTDMSLKGIARNLEVDHTTVIDHVKRAKIFLHTNDEIFFPAFYEVYNKLFPNEA